MWSETTSNKKKMKSAIVAMHGPHILVRSGNYARFSTGKFAIHMVTNKTEKITELTNNYRCFLKIDKKKD